MKPFVRRNAALVLLLAACATPLGAEINVDKGTGDLIGEVAEVIGNFKLSKLPAELHITSQRMQFDYKRGRLSYDGSVEVNHGNIVMRSNQLLLTFEPGKAEEVREIIASGSVEVVRDKEIARGQTAVYNPTAATLRLTGAASLASGANVVKGESVVVYLDEGRAIVEGGKGPVRAVIDPGSLDDEEFLN